MTLLQGLGNRSARAIAPVLFGLLAAGADASIYPETPTSRQALEAQQEEADRDLAKRVDAIARVASALNVAAGADEADRRHGMGGSIFRLLEIAVDPSASSHLRNQATSLLPRAAAHVDPFTARQAERALETLRQLAEQPTRVRSQAEEQAWRQQRDREKLRSVMERLTVPNSPRRGVMAATFFALATAEPQSAHEARTFAYWMRRDSDPQVARWGEALVARLEARAPAPELVPPYEPSAQRLRIERRREEELFEMALDSDPQQRRHALGRLTEMALDENHEAKPEIVHLLTAAAADPDSGVSAYARFMLRALDGDWHALGMVYVADEAAH